MHQAHTGHMVSTVCVDVRELLRQAAPLSTTTSAPFGAPRDTVGDELPPLCTVSPGTTQQGISSVLWAPSGADTRGSYLPPPLSPADATVMHAILETPSPSGSTHTEATNYSVSWERRSIPKVQLKKRGCNGGAVPRLKESSRRAPRGLSPEFRRDLAVSHAGPVEGNARPKERRPHSLVTASQRSKRVECESLVAADEAAKLYVSPVPRQQIQHSVMPPVELSSSAQSVIERVLSNLHHRTEGNGGVLTRHLASPSPSLEAEAHTDVIVGTPSQLGEADAQNGDDSATPQRKVEEESSSALPRPPVSPQANRTIEDLWRRCPRLGSIKSNYRYATSPQPPPYAFASCRNQISIPQLQPDLQRSVPSAFRKQLHFMESTPTTRRPKRR